MGRGGDRKYAFYTGIITWDGERGGGGGKTELKSMYAALEPDGTTQPLQQQG